MDTQSIMEAIVKNVYHINSSSKIALHKHDKRDEIFYCMSGNGYGVLEDSEVELTIGKAFIVPAGVMHSLRTDSDLVVASFMLPVIKE